jgi:hypothetical protein
LLILTGDININLLNSDAPLSFWRNNIWTYYQRST